MADRHALDLDRLRAWLAEQLPGADGVVMAAKFPGGQSNPTYAVSIDGTLRFVLRKKPAGALLPSAHAIEREYRVTAALQDSGIPVARPLALCEDERVIGTPFFVMEHVPGRTFWDARMPDLPPAERAAMYDATNRALAELHRIDPQAVGLAEFGRADEYLARQVNRWTRQYRASETARIDAMEHLIAWLPAHLPARRENRIVHGDFRSDNIIFAEDEPAIRAVIDWELSTLGDPLADLAQHVIAWRLPHEGYRGLAGIDHVATGIPDEASYVRRYWERTGAPAPDPALWAFALAFALFRNAAIRQGVYRRALDGNASSSEATVHGARAAAIAGLGWRIAAGDHGASLDGSGSA